MIEQGHVIYRPLGRYKQFLGVLLLVFASHIGRTGGIIEYDLNPQDDVTKRSCLPIKRGGFYLHDSTKGYSHGCIEVEGAFFTQLRAYIKINKEKRLKLQIKYSGGSTYGGTKIP